MLQSLLFLIAVQFSTPPTGPALYSGGSGGGGDAACELTGDLDCQLSGQFRGFATSTTTKPQYSFVGNLTSGLLLNSGVLQLVRAGVARLTVDSFSMQFGGSMIATDGLLSGSSPTYTFGGVSSSGFGYDTPNTSLRFFFNGAKIGMNNTSFSPVTTNAYDLGTVSAMWRQVFHAAGTAAAPSVSWTAGNGFYLSATNELGVATAGAQRYAFQTGAFLPLSTQTLGTPANSWEQLFVDVSIVGDNDGTRLSISDNDGIEVTTALVGTGYTGANATAVRAYWQLPVIDITASNTNEPSCSVLADIGKTHIAIEPIGHGSTSPFSIECKCTAVQRASGTSLAIGWMIYYIDDAGVLRVGPTAGVSTCHL